MAQQSYYGNPAVQVQRRLGRITTPQPLPIDHQWDPANADYSTNNPPPMKTGGDAGTEYTPTADIPNYDVNPNLENPTPYHLMGDTAPTPTTTTGGYTAPVSPHGGMTTGHAPGEGWADINGWVPGKMNDLTHHTPKYDFMRMVQSYGAVGGGLGAGGDRASMAKDLPALIEILKHGSPAGPDGQGGWAYPNAKLVGDDSIDFGDGNGPIDVLTGNGEWWWGAGGGGGGGTGPGGPGGNPWDTPGGGANDPFGDMIQKKLEELINNNGRLGPDTEALDLENVRQAADRARNAEYSGVMSQLAGRGVLPEGVKGGQGGLALDALGRIERNDIAPLMSAGVRDYQLHRSDQANSNLMSALSQGSGRQGMLSDIALRTLAQNQQFSQFLATFGLERDKTLYELQHGGNDALLNLLMLFIQQNKSGNSGHA